jgi:dolichol-phosphate mannosyltransferase
MLSIIVPTYNEAENLPLLCQKISEAMIGRKYEILIMDDRSLDGTDRVCESLSVRYPLSFFQSNDRPRDLSLSVMEGISEAAYDFVVVMDADLSHPAEMLPILSDALSAQISNFILGSRYVKEGSFDRDWSIWRFLNSYLATLLAKPLVKCSDPMSGFFIFDKTNLDLSALRPIGYKIGLEIMMRGRFDQVVELPIQFRDREKGESKMNLSQQFKYLRHLRRLYLFKYGTFAEFISFGVVGGSGFLVDILFYFLFQMFGLPHLMARALSFFPAASWNWVLNRMTTFGERKKRPKTRQWLEFIASGVVGFGINYGVYAVLTTRLDFFDDYRVLALVAGVACGSIFNFAAASLFVYSEKRHQ